MYILRFINWSKYKAHKPLYSTNSENIFLELLNWLKKITLNKCTLLLKRKFYGFDRYGLLNKREKIKLETII